MGIKKSGTFVKRSSVERSTPPLSDDEADSYQDEEEKIEEDFEDET